MQAIRTSNTTGPQGAASRRAAFREAGRAQTIFADAESPNARASFERGPFRLVDRPEDADLLWLREPEVFDSLIDDLAPFQVINHIPNEAAIADKGHLAENLYAYDRLRREGDLPLHGLVQETYRLYDPRECARFFEQLPKKPTKDNLWILKRCDAAEGVGIRILWRFGALKRFCERALHPRPGEVYARYVIQRYIQNPLLLDGRKSEIRVYWLIASLDPLLVLVYRDGTVRLNTRPFVLDDFGNTLIHVTNIARQIAHPERDPSAILKWSFAAWERHLVKERRLAPPRWLDEHLRPHVKRMLSYVVRAAAKELAVGLPERGLCAALYGADIILDDTLHPWLTEVQEGPGLSFDDPIKRALIPQMLVEAAAIMLEVARRKKAGRSLKRLDAAQRFEWVINDAAAPGRLTAAGRPAAPGRPDPGVSGQARARPQGRCDENKDAGMTQLPPSYFTDEDSDLARQVFARGPYREAASAQDADLLWFRHRAGYKPLFPKLKPWQALNHLPNEFSMADKGYLAEHLYAHDRKLTATDFRVKDLVQETYCLYIPEQRERFFAQLPKKPSRRELWILKRCDSSEGNGIYVLWQFDELRRFYADADKPRRDEVLAPYVIQRYIRNPLLLDGRKSEIRIYWLIASVDPLLVLMYREGTVRLNTLPFKLADFGNPLIHVTNIAQQKRHPDHDPAAVLKWSFPAWERYLVEERKIAPKGFVARQLRPHLKRMLSFVVRATAASLAKKLPKQGLCFGHYGADIILDETLHPWLTEIQEGPAIDYDDPVKRRVIPPMLAETAAIMLEIAQRKRTGASLQQLDSVKRYQWVINDA